MKYKVEFCQDNLYKVIEFNYIDDENIEEDAVYYGDLANCEAYIRLHEKGYM